MKLELPYPPTLNTMYPTGRSGRRFLSKKGKDFKNEVYALTLEQHGIFKPFTGPVSATIHLAVPDLRKRDLDNTFKAIFDALKHANVYMDDEQVVEIHAYKLPKVKGGTCRVDIERIKMDSIGGDYLLF